MGVNKVILLGNLGKDPEIRYTSQQTAVCRFSLATSERRKDQSGNWTDHTEWHNVVSFGKTAENCAQYLKKGRQVFVEGKIQTSKWQDKEGKDRYTTEIIANTVQFVGGRDAGSGRGRSAEVETAVTSDEAAAGQELVASLSSADSIASSGGGSTAGGGNESFDDDDIPF
jgi:single-strand DNA-binding protein